MDEPHIVSRGVPTIVEDIAKLQLIMKADKQQLAIEGIFGLLAAPFDGLRLGIEVDLGFGDNVKGDGQADLTHLIESSE